MAIAPYRTPGTPEMGKLVADLVDKHNTILMANHGVVTWSHISVEDAYFKMEILEAYCRTVLVAAQLGKPAEHFIAATAAGPAQDQAEPGHPRPALRPQGMRAVRQRRMAARGQCAVPSPTATPSLGSTPKPRRWCRPSPSRSWRR